MTTRRPGSRYRRRSKLGILRSIESRLERVVEGSVGRLFRASVAPVELARKLAKELEEGKVVSVTQTYAPNEYTIYLSPRDRTRFADFEASLRNELASYLAEHARRAGYVMPTRPRVRFETESSLHTGIFGISTALVRDDDAPLEPLAAPRRAAPAAPPPRPGRCAARLPGRRRLPPEVPVRRRSCPTVPSVPPIPIRRARPAPDRTGGSAAGAPARARRSPCARRSTPIRPSRPAASRRPAPARSRARRGGRAPAVRAAAARRAAAAARARCPTCRRAAAAPAASRRRCRRSRSSRGPTRR